MPLLHCTLLCCFALLLQAAACCCYCCCTALLLLRAAAVPHPRTPSPEKKTAGEETFNISILVFSTFYISNLNILLLQFQHFKSQMLNIFSKMLSKFY